MDYIIVTRVLFKNNSSDRDTGLRLVMMGRPFKILIKPSNIISAAELDRYDFDPSSSNFDNFKPCTQLSIQGSQLRYLILESIEELYNKLIEFDRINNQPIKDTL